MAIEVKRTFDILDFCLSKFSRKDALGGKNGNDWYVYSTAEYVEKSHQFAIGLMALGLKKATKLLPLPPTGLNGTLPTWGWQ
jgi:long-chain acyl-CoA synthetase